MRPAKSDHHALQFGEALLERLGNRGIPALVIGFRDCFPEGYQFGASQLPPFAPVIHGKKQGREAVYQPAQESRFSALHQMLPKSFFLAPHPLPHSFFRKEKKSLVGAWDEFAGGSE